MDIKDYNKMVEETKQKDWWAVIPPQFPKEILAAFKHKGWAEEWRDKYSATSGVFSIPNVNYSTSITAFSDHELFTTP